MFQNIFSKVKPERENPKIPVKIIADTREKNSLVIPTLHELNCEIELKQLEIGDYQISDIIIERKTFNDFISSMINRRLIQQLNQMQQYKRKILIIEGKAHIDEYCDLHPNSYKGFILSITTNYQIPIIFTEDPEETALYLTLLAKQQLKSNQEISLHSKIPKTKKEQQKYIIESFPNIGPKTAERLLNQFKSPINIFNASIEELEKIIKSKAKIIKDILT